MLALLGGALSTSFLLSGCLGNPPSRREANQAATIPINRQASSKLETGTVSLGFIPILESAPLVVGVEKGFFAKHGLDVNLAKQSSWSTARDNVVLGSSGGGIDGGQWQLPMPQMISEGALTNGKKVPMVILAMLMSQGNGIAAANSVKDGDLSVDLRKTSPGFFQKFSQKEGRKFRASYSFPKANHRSRSRNPAGDEERNDGSLLHGRSLAIAHQQRRRGLPGHHHSPDLEGAS
jgi:bicarbonate transport system substrate-binding protein